MIFNHKVQTFNNQFMFQLWKMTLLVEGMPHLRGYHIECKHLIMSHTQPFGWLLNSYLSSIYTYFKYFQLKLKFHYAIMLKFTQNMSFSYFFSYVSSNLKKIGYNYVLIF